MDEQARWVTKAEAARELEMSLSTLDRKIRRGEIEVRRKGPEYVSDEELLRRSLAREDKLQQRLWELNERASELERERDEARESVSASLQAYEEMEEAYRKERSAHGRTKRLAMRLGLAATALFVICALVTWRLLTSG